MHRIPVHQIMQTQLVTVQPGQLVADAAQLMHDYNIRHLPVVDADGYLVGIVTDSDVREAESADSVLNTYTPEREEEWLTVGEIMTPDVITIGPDATVGEVASKLIQHKVSGLPVVTASGSHRKQQLVGIVTETDIFLLIASAWQAEVAGN